jgi:mannose-6-phosphate isomerase-like protein (cupin superfamily)
MEKVILADKFRLFNEYWSPKIVAQLNGQHIKLVKLKGEFVWHHHDQEDELFLVVKGSLRIELGDQIIELEEGEFFVVPAGVDHRPVAEQEAQVLLLEPISTLNTGNRVSEQTIEKPEWI